jgi:hypothetical protein
MREEIHIHDVFESVAGEKRFLSFLMDCLRALILKVLSDLESYPCLAAFLETPPDKAVLRGRQQILEDKAREDAHPEVRAFVGVAIVGFLRKSFGGNKLFFQAEMGGCCLFLVIL